MLNLFIGISGKSLIHSRIGEQDLNALRIITLYTYQNPSMQGAQQDPELEQIYMVIGNPYMRAIIRKIGESGEVSFSELKEAVGTSTGNLYYNLDKLSGFVSKNERRKYVLTEKGVRLYRYLYENETRIKSLLGEKNRLALIIEKYLLPVIVPETLASYLYSQPLTPYFVLVLYTFITMAGIVAGSYVLFGLDQLYAPAIISLRLGLWFAGILVLLILLELSSRLLGGDKKLGVDYFSTILLATSLLYLPAFIPLDIFYVNILYRLIQIIVLGVITAAIKVYKKLPTERAFIPVFVAYYASFNLAIMVQRLL